VFTGSGLLIFKHGILLGSIGLDDKDQSPLILLCYQPAYKENYRYFIVKRKILCYNAFKYVLNGIYFKERIS